MKRFFKQTVALILVTLTLVSTLSVFAVSASAAQTYDPNEVVDLAKDYLGSTKWDRGYCLRFVANIHQEAYHTSYSSACCAYKYGTSYLDDTGRDNIPIGADVFFTGSTSKCKTCKNKCGHVGIYIGDGYIIHNWSGVIRKHKISDITKSGTYKYRGWGWHANKSFEVSEVSAEVTAPTLKTNTYYNFTNLRSDKLLNVYGSRSKSNTNVTIYREDGTSGQDFKLVEHGTVRYNGKVYTKYIIVARCAPSCALNVYGSSAKNGAKVNMWSKTSNSTQDWILEAVSGGYVIRSANNPTYVLCASGTANSSGVKLSKYSAGNTYQIWGIS